MHARDVIEDDFGARDGRDRVGDARDACRYRWSAAAAAKAAQRDGGLALAVDAEQGVNACIGVAEHQFCRHFE